MNLSVQKYPSSNVLAICKQIGDETIVDSGAELMTEEQYIEWTKQPEQVAFMQRVASEYEANNEAAKAQAKQAKIDEMVAATGMSEAACAFILKNQGII